MSFKNTTIKLNGEQIDLINKGIKFLSYKFERRAKVMSEYHNMCEDWIEENAKLEEELESKNNLIKNLESKLKSFTVDYMMKINDCNEVTILEGDGEFLDHESGDVYKIHSIKLPFNSSGKHITVHSKEDADVVEDRGYFDGKILSFECDKVYHWEF